MELLLQLDRLAITIQAVRQKDKVIDTVRSAAFWQHITVQDLEWARTELRGIMKYKQKPRPPERVDETTTSDDGVVIDKERNNVLSSETEALQYRRRLKEILDKMIATSPVLQKIRQDKPVQPAELDSLASAILTENPGVDLKVLNEFYGRTAANLQATLRELVGMEAGAVEAHFTLFLHQHPQLTHLQVRFMNLLKQYISENGTITIEKLYQAPFTSVSHEGIDGVFQPQDVTAIATVLKPFMAAAKPVKPAQSPAPSV